LTAIQRRDARADDANTTRKEHSMKLNRHPLGLIAMMIAFALPAAASERTMYVEYIPKAEFDHGRGFDATAMEVLAPCVEGTVKSLGSGSQSINSEMKQVESSSQLDESLGIGAAASLGYGSFSMSAAAKYAQSHSLNSFAVTYTARSEIESATLALDSPRLKEEFRTMKYLDFRDKCGDYYVDGITTGGEYVAVVTVTTQSSKDKEDVSAQLNAAVNMMGSASVSAEFNKTMERVASSHEMKITEIRKGGAGEPIAVDASTMVENFRNFARSVNDRPAYYQVVLKKYSTLPNYPYNPSDPQLESALATIDTLANLNHTWSTILNDVNVFKNHPKQFRGDNPAILARWEDEVRGVLATLGTAIRSCAANYSDCRVPSLGRDPNDYRSNYPEWKPDAEWVAVDGLSGAVRHVSVGSKGTVWALVAKPTAGGMELRRLNGNAWVPVDGGLTSLSVAADGTVWGVNSNQDVFRWEGEKWAGIQSAKLTNISVGSANNVLGVNAAGEAVRWTGSNWAPLGVSTRVEQVVAGSDGSIALRSPSGDLALFGSSLSNLKAIAPGRLIVDVAVGNRDNVYVIDGNGDLFAWDVDEGKLGGTLGKFTKVSASADGSVWAIDGQGQMFRLDKM
jgi:virginiamycin B lyase